MISNTSKDLSKLLVIVDLQYCKTEAIWLDALDELASFAKLGSFVLQVRVKNVSSKELYRLAALAYDIVKGRVPLMLNGNGEIAHKLGYFGVHFPEHLRSEIPKFKDTGLVTSVAIHSPELLELAVVRGVSMIVYSPIFEPSWKSSDREDLKGIDGLQAAVQKANVPIFALGGIGVNDVKPCLRAGAAGVAVLSGVVGSPNRHESVRHYLDALGPDIELQKPD